MKTQVTSWTIPGATAGMYGIRSAHEVLSEEA